MIKLTVGKVFPVQISRVSNCNSNSIFIAPNLHLKTDSRRNKQKQKTIIINLGHSKGQRHEEKPVKAKVRVDMLVRRDRL